VNYLVMVIKDLGTLPEDVALYDEHFLVNCLVQHCSSSARVGT